MIYILQEGAQSLVRAPGEVGAEATVVNLVLWLKLLVEAVGAAVIVLGVLITVYKFARSLAPPQFGRYNEIRLTLALHRTLLLVSRPVGRRARSQNSWRAANPPP